MAATVFLSVLLSWLVAGLLKAGVEGRWKAFARPGGMPSTHSALVASLVAAVGLEDGIRSTVFAVSLAFAVVVIHDALRIRRQHTAFQALAGILVGVLGAIAARIALT